MSQSLWAAAKRPVAPVRRGRAPEIACRFPPGGGPVAARIRLLGDFSVDIDGRRVGAVAWRRRHAAALVKLLALRPHRQLHRERVIDSLWPDLRVEEAAPRLYKAAHFARKV